MKVLKIFLCIAIFLLLIVGLYSKIQKTEFGYTSVKEDVHGINHIYSINLTGNMILSGALILAIPLVIILKRGSR